MRILVYKNGELHLKVFKFVASAAVDAMERVSPSHEIHPVSLPDDPLDRLEVELSAERVAATAAGLMEENESTCLRIMRALAEDGKAAATEDDMWALIQGLNGVYASLRSAQLADNGVDYTPGEAAEADVDGALSAILGGEYQDNTAVPLEGDVALFAVLTQAAIDAVSE